MKIKEIFHSIQGEGPYAGRPAWFIRLADCPLRCPGCDTDFLNGTEMTVDEILSHLIGFNRTTLVVLTGGEPLAQDIRELCSSLIDKRFLIQVETSGVACLDANIAFLKMMRNWVKIVCSPKGTRLATGLESLIGFYKYVCAVSLIDDCGLPMRTLRASDKINSVYRDQDFLIYNPDKVFLQPLDEGDPIKNRNNLMFCAETCAEYGFRLTVQMHKMIDWR